MSIRPGELVLHDEARADRHTLALAGELDLMSGPSLEAAIARLCGDGAGEVTVDLRELAFIDAAGLRAILHGMELCEAHGCGFGLVRGSASVQRLFELTGLADTLPFRDD